MKKVCGGFTSISINLVSFIKFSLSPFSWLLPLDLLLHYLTSTLLRPSSFAHWCCCPSLLHPPGHLFPPLLFPRSLRHISLLHCQLRMPARSSFWTSGRSQRWPSLREPAAPDHHPPPLQLASAGPNRKYRQHEANQTQQGVFSLVTLYLSYLSVSFITLVRQRKLLMAHTWLVMEMMLSSNDTAERRKSLGS